MNKIEAVVFDMDGLMFDTEKLWLDGVAKTNEVFGYNVPLELIISCMGLRIDKIDIRLKEHLGEDFDTAKFRELNKKFMKEDVEKNGLRKKKGLVELLEFLKSKGVKMAVASSSKIAKINERFSQAGLSKDYFSVIVGGDEVTNPKPHPQIYLLACEKLGVNPKNSLALEDSESGIMSAFNAGMKPILVPDLKIPSDEVKNKAFKIFESLDQVISLFE